jgi:S-DNA-T family DNA segregation ATPase FtsK/SpoIIIE
MPCQPSRRALSVLASALAATGVVLAAAGCSKITPLGPDAAPVNLPPARDLGSPIIMQIMRSQPPTPTGRCPASSIALFGSEPNVPRAGPPIPVPVHSQLFQGSTATSVPIPAATPTAPPAGVACYRPVGTPVTITSAAVSSVTTNRNQPGPAWYVLVVAFPTADVAALTALIRQAYDSGDAVGMSVAGKLWQAPQPRREFNALRAEQINLLSRSQAFQLYRLLVPSG